MSLDPYKGVRDFYPEDQRVQNFIFSAMRRAAESYGYEEMNASILEPTELYTAKTSEEIVREQTYTFTDRGERSVTLRPEMTPTVARMVAAKRRELGMPLRWYSIQNFFRYERPQRGRLREFWQLNADLFGVPSRADDVRGALQAEVEILQVASRVMSELGATQGDYTIKIASRNALEIELIKRNIPIENHRKISQLIDKKGKIPEADRVKELNSLGGNFEIRESADLIEIRRILTELGIGNVVFDPEIVRGFDYYTGMVFEVFDTDPANKRSMFGGGRYDKLIEGYGGSPTPAVGFAMGDVIARDFLETHNLLSDIQPTTLLYLAPVTEKDTLDTMKVAEELRLAGISISLGMSHSKIGDHIKAAEKLGIPHFAAYGTKEKESGLITIKTLSSGAEETVTVSAVSEYLLSR